MAKRRSGLSSLLLLAVLFAGVWLYYTPYLAMNKLQKAAKAGDTQTLNEMVDFPALRESVKHNVRSAVSNEVGRRAGGLGALGGLLAGALATPLVDAFVTPEGIAALTEGQRPGSRHGSEVDSIAREQARDVEVKRGYESLDLFVVRFVGKEDGEEKMALVLHRDGFTSWRLTGVRLPAATRTN
ncbi:MAG TPA: DUF2939 domain-containing protein [Longimicrobium sp.]|nr:DUF2939 domain-containing protein [Longimicrobium sp.]